MWYSAHIYMIYLSLVICLMLQLQVLIYLLLSSVWHSIFSGAECHLSSSVTSYLVMFVFVCFVSCRMPSVIIRNQLFGYICFFVLLAAECHLSLSVTSYLVMFVFVCFVGCRMPSVIICYQLFGYVCFCLFCWLQNAICHHLLPAIFSCMCFVRCKMWFATLCYQPVVICLCLFCSLAWPDLCG